MKRPFRFRIYDTKRKEWVHDTEHAINLLGEIVIMGEILRRPDDHIVKLSDLNDLVVMQFTGFQDKLHKPIFEGDILEYKEPKIKKYTEVKWVAGGFRITDGNQPLHELMIMDYWKVRGNIYDNPELLEAQNGHA